MKFNEKMLLLYAVTDQAWVGKQTLLEQIEDALKGGATIVQLREKKLDEDSFVEEAIQARDLCHKYNVPLIINDNVDVALKSGADGVHVGIEDAPVAEIRQRVPADRPAHRPGRNRPRFPVDFRFGQLRQPFPHHALGGRVNVSEFPAGADYMGVGAVFPSPTKTNAVRITNEQLREIISSVSIPAVAIGGISYDNVCEIKGNSVSGVAVVSAIFGAEDIEKATALLKERVKAVVED